MTNEPKTVYVAVTYKGATAHMDIQLSELQQDDYAGNDLIYEALAKIKKTNEDE